ncbi:uncharacterized protein LOC144197088 isoform X2 [Stigmatopora nigra]
MNILNTYTEVKEMLPKFFCFVLMVATHRVITGQSRVRVTGTLGKKVTLPFTFNNSVSNARHFALYQNYNKKAEYCPSRDCSNELGFDIYSENASVFGQITNLTQGHSGIYWATLFLEAGTTQMSGIVDLIIREEKNNDTGTKPQPDSSPIPEVASFESHDMAEGALAYSVVNISKIRHADTQLDRTPEVQYANIFGNNKIFI